MPSIGGVEFELYMWASGIIILTTVLVKLAVGKQNFHEESGRKILHIVAILTCGYVVWQTEYTEFLALLFFAFFGILLFVVHYKLLLPNERRSYGIALFPLAFGVLLLTPLHRDAIIFGIVTLGISDALAGWAGQKLNFRKIIFLYEEKSWPGFFVFYISTVLISATFIGFLPSIFLLALVPALSELFSYRGSDNLTIPMAAAFWFDTLVNQTITPVYWVILVVMIALMVIAGSRKWLNASGMTAALLLGVIILFAGDVLFLLPMGLFFVAGSITSRLHKAQKDTKGRNSFQVFANGLVAVLSLWIYSVTKNDVFLTGYLTSIAISFADTMSSDLGTYFKQKTYDIITLRPVTVGLSGGISLAGTLAGIIAAVGFSLLSCFVFGLNPATCFIIFCAGVAGMLIDSILGSIWQAKYVYAGNVTEDKNNNGTLVRGYSWLDNDGVNFISNLVVTIIFVSIGFIF
jgi:uncharacterized protein (TIGR00297 family)